MSKWMDVRDSIVEALKVEEVGNNLKQNFIGCFEDEGVSATGVI